MQRPIILDGFISRDFCRELVATFEASEHLLDRTAWDPTWRNRVLHTGLLPSGPGSIRERISLAKLAAIEEIRRAYGVRDHLFPDDTQIVRWLPGMSMGVHADQMRHDGTPNEYPWRDFSAVIYLNDDYDGGEVHFPNHGLQVKPSAGMLVAFKGNTDDLHGVREVTRGTRYTMPDWFTRDISRADHAFLEDIYG